jgi:two-component system chemotaxis response regulator CheB
LWNRNECEGEALERIPRIKQQVICIELEMPVMDGLDLTRGIMATDPCPILLVSRFGKQEDREKIFQLFEAGTLEVFPMPDYEGKHVLSASAQALINKIKILSGVVVLRRRQILSPMAMKPDDALLDEYFPTVQGKF